MSSPKTPRSKRASNRASQQEELVRRRTEEESARRQAEEDATLRRLVYGEVERGPLYPYRPEKRIRDQENGGLWGLGDQGASVHGSLMPDIPYSDAVLEGFTRRVVYEENEVIHALNRQIILLTNSLEYLNSSLLQIDIYLEDRGRSASSRKELVKEKKEISEEIRKRENMINKIKSEMEDYKKNPRVRTLYATGSRKGGANKTRRAHKK
jgi:hypothetical protein